MVAAAESACREPEGRRPAVRLVVPLVVAAAFAVAAAAFPAAFAAEDVYKRQDVATGQQV